jgi:threonine dehydrogenase-like Zn-dependent dehydrogenase
MSELRVAVVEQPGAPPVIRLLDRPLLPAGSALVSVLACALDAEDARPLASAAPLVPGRHFVGAIDSLGSGLTEDATGNRLRPGTPVLVPSVIPCGTCALCRQPPRHATGCLSPLRLGADAGPAGLSGGLADAVFVPRGAIHALPLTLPPWLATLAEPLATCLRAFGRAQEIGRFQPGSSVVVTGHDATALLAVVAARELGAGPILMIGGPDTPFLRLARRFGAEATIDTTDVTNPTERIAIARETIGGRGVDLAVARNAGSSEALAMLREGGTLVTMGTDEDAPSPWSIVRDRQLAVLGADGFAPTDIPVALGMLYRARARIDFAAMHARFPFSAAGIVAALAALRDAETPRALVVQRPDLAG